jgi:hypothetical protein
MNGKNRDEDTMKGTMQSEKTDAITVQRRNEFSDMVV